MSEKDWTEIETSAPHTFAACKAYFQKRYLTGWRQQMGDVTRILEFLRTKGIGIKISGWQGNWVYRLWKDETLINSAKTADESHATTEPIKHAFKTIEGKEDRL